MITFFDIGMYCRFFKIDFDFYLKGYIKKINYFRGGKKSKWRRREGADCFLMRIVLHLFVNFIAILLKIMSGCHTKGVRFFRFRRNEAGRNKWIETLRTVGRITRICEVTYFYPP